MTWKRLKAGVYESGDYMIVRLPEHIRIPWCNQAFPEGLWVVLYQKKAIGFSSKLKTAKRRIELGRPVSTKPISSSQAQALKDAATEALGENSLSSRMRYNVDAMAVRQWRECTRPEGARVPGQGHYRTLRIAKKAAKYIFSEAIELERKHPRHHPLKELKVSINRGYDTFEGEIVGLGMTYMWHNDPSFKPIEMRRKV